jgi:calcineurin-like phosphoesterase family protein
MRHTGAVSTTYYTADLHFTHKMVAGLRGFNSPEEHDEAVIATWNATISREDVVWLLGDVGMGKPERFWPLVERLNGTIHLIAGNHDAVWPGHRDAHKHQRAWLEAFASVQCYARRRLAGHDVLLSHFPYGGDHSETDRYPQYRLRDEGLWLLHGHTHSRARLSTGRQVHVGLDAWELKPVPQHEIERLIAADGAWREMVALGEELRESA